MTNTDQLTAATGHGRELVDLYTRLRQTCDGAERVNLLRRASQSADALGAMLQQLPRDTNADTDGDQALRCLSEVLERVMTIEREYRFDAGAGDASRTEG